MFHLPLDLFCEAIARGVIPRPLRFRTKDGLRATLRATQDGPNDIVWVELTYDDPCNLDGFVISFLPQVRGSIQHTSATLRQLLADQRITG